MPKKIFSDFITQLTKISPRRGHNEEIAFSLITNFLNKENIQFEVQEFNAKIPVTEKTQLVVDGKSIPCLGASFESGKIDNSSRIVKSFEKFTENSVIVYSPEAYGICIQSIKNVPALAVNKGVVEEIRNGTDIKGEVVIKEEEYTSHNILIGNITDPKRIVFAHYDSICGSGATDDGAADDVLYRTIVENRELLKDNLFVFAGCEEESLSKRIGFYGFEVFDSKYSDILNYTKEIIVLDGLGVGMPCFVKQDLDWVFDISRLSEVSDKVCWMRSDEEIVRKYYHSSLDTLDILDPVYIDEAKKLLVERLLTK